MLKTNASPLALEYEKDQTICALCQMTIALIPGIYNRAAIGESVGRARNHENPPVAPHHFGAPDRVAVRRAGRG